MLTLALARTPGWLSSYDDHDASNGPLGPLPHRMRWLHPEALAALSPVADSLVFTDVYRSASGSLAARRVPGKGAARPGFSGHNFGLCVDLDVRRSLTKIGTSKGGLDGIMAGHGWLCWREDHDPDAIESWHYTWGATTHRGAGIEARIQSIYGGQLTISPTEAQAYLSRAGLYHGQVDGKLGPQSRAAISALQRAFDMLSNGELDPGTQRLIAVISAAPPAAPIPLPPA